MASTTGSAGKPQERLRPARGIEPPYTPEELADLLGVTEKTLETWRREGIGPDPMSLTAKVVRYRHEAVKRWFDEKERKDRAGQVAA
jgi:phage terminase Nu1 subunit (DNA packaging protein)